MNKTDPPTSTAGDDLTPSRLIAAENTSTINLGTITIPEVLLHHADPTEVSEAAHLAILEAQMAALSALANAAGNYLAKVRNGVA